MTADVPLGALLILGALVAFAHALRAANRKDQP